MFDTIDDPSLLSEFNYDGISFDMPAEQWLDMPSYTGDDLGLVQGDFDYVPLSAPDYGPAGPDLNFTHQGFPGSEEAVNGVKAGPSDVVGPGTGSWLDGVSGTFSGLMKGITAVGTSSRTQQQNASQVSGPKNAIDAVAGLIQNLGTTARIVQDTKARITNAPGDINKAIKQARDLTNPTTQRNAVNTQPGKLNPMILIGAAAVAGFFLLKAV